MECLKAKRGFGLRSQSGQGIIEYILVLIVIVITVLGFTYQLNTAFAQFAENYFGEYLACLLETGELPSLGGTANAAGLCNEKFEPFDLANGRKLVDDGSGNNSGGGRGNNGSGGDGSGSGNDQGGTPATGESGGEQSGRASYAGPAGGGGGSGRGLLGNNRFRAGSSQGGEGSAGTGEERKLYTGSTDNSIPGSALNPNSGEASRIPIRNIDRSFGLQDLKRDEEPTRAKVNISKNSSNQINSKDSIKINRIVASKEAPDDDDDFSFGNILRWLIIAAIIIAIVIFVGGQMLQISKSME